METIVTITSSFCYISFRFIFNLYIYILNLYLNIFLNLLNNYIEFILFSENLDIVYGWVSGRLQRPGENMALRFFCSVNKNESCKQERFQK